MKKKLCLLLAVLMLASGTLSCAEKNEKEPSSGNETTGGDASSDDTSENMETEEETDTLTDYERRQLVPDNLPDVTYNGDSFRIMYANWYMDCANEIKADEMTGDSLNDSIYERNATIEDRFNVSIEPIDGGYSHDKLNEMALTGISAAEVVGCNAFACMVPYAAKACLNWHDVPHIDFDKPWNNKLANDNGTINNRLFGMCSDISLSSMTFTFAIFFNMTLIQNYGYTSSDLYTMVRDGSWTIDKLSEIVSEAYNDIDANGTADDDDFYGFGYQLSNAADVWLTAFDQPILTITPDNTVDITFMNDKTLQILDKLLVLHNSTGFRKFPRQYDEETHFANNKLLMAPLRFYAAFTTLRTMEAPYSLIPYPKWDEAQDAYYTNADDKFTLFLLPIPNVDNLDFIGVIYEALSAESYKTVYPVYYDEGLKGRYSEEPETAEMVDLVMQGRNFDLTFQYGDSVFQRLPYLIRDMIIENKNELASTYAGFQKVLKKSIEKEFLPLYLDDNTADDENKN